MNGYKNQITDRIMNKLFHKNISSFITENSTSTFCSYTAFGNAIAVSATGGKTHIECLLPIPFCERVKSLENLLNNKLSVNFPMLHLFDINKNKPDPFTKMIENITYMAANGEYELIVITDFYPIFKAGILPKKHINRLIEVTDKKTKLILTGKIQSFDNIIGEKFLFTSKPNDIKLPCHIWINGEENEKHLLCLGLTSLSAISGVSTACSTLINDSIQLEFLSKITPKIEFISHNKQSEYNMVIIENDFELDGKETEIKLFMSY